MAEKIKTFEQHKQRHIKLHRYLDELVYDWIEETGGLPSNCSVTELVEWSYCQSIYPTDRNGRFAGEKEIDRA